MNITPQIQDISVDELTRFTAEHSEHEYLLVDVREPEEYEEAHIPGARLVPLMDILEGKAEIAPSNHAIFYCRSGARSLRGASVAAARNLGIKKFYNLSGGIMAFEGKILTEPPNLKAFDGTEDLQGLLVQAMDLEKAADNLYGALGNQLVGTPVEGLVEKLEEGEEGHARAIYGMLRKVSTEPVPPFEDLYDGLKGSVLESGEPVVKLVSWIASAEASQAAVLELALDLELKAYDMYRNLAEATEDPELKGAFLDLAHHERRHARTVARSIGKLVSANA